MTNLIAPYSNSDNTTGYGKAANHNNAECVVTFSLSHKPHDFIKRYLSNKFVLRIN